MSNGVDFRKLALDLREQLTAAQSELAALRTEKSELIAADIRKNGEVRGLHRELAALREELADMQHWRDLALQFDNHRMIALWHLKTLAINPSYAPAVSEFLASPPLPSSEVVQRLTAAEQRNATIFGKVDKCKECGSDALFWFSSNSNTSDIAEGRLRTNEVTCTFVLGCADCSATIKTVRADRIAECMTKAMAKPTESVARYQCPFDGGTCGLGGQCNECPHKESGVGE